MNTLNINAELFYKYTYITTYLYASEKWLNRRHNIRPRMVQGSKSCFNFARYLKLRPFSYPSINQSNNQSKVGRYSPTQRVQKVFKRKEMFNLLIQFLLE